MRQQHSGTGRLASLVALVALGACTGPRGSYVWIEQFHDTQRADSVYTIDGGDLIAVQVWDHPELSTRARVRDDGRVSIPLLGDVAAGRSTAAGFARSLEGELKSRGLVPSPRVTVALEERRPLRVAVLGEVARAGVYQLDPGAGVAEAIASAGGLSTFAHRDRIFVTRRGATPVRIRFSFASLGRPESGAASFQLRPGDVVTVE